LGYPWKAPYWLYIQYFSEIEARNHDCEATFSPLFIGSYVRNEPPPSPAGNITAR
jgi:hypothetical protein